MNASRRSVLRAGLGALTAGLLAPKAGARLFPAPPTDPGDLDNALGAPIRPIAVGPSVLIDGLPFHRSWLGDHFAQSAIPFHHGELPDGGFPAPDEHVDVAVVGGGLSGLAAAYALRDRKPVVFELHHRFGGTCQGESIDGLDYSLGGAYFISPDPGSELEALYHELGLDLARRESPPTDDPTVINGRIVEGFWDGLGLSEPERLAFEEYRALVLAYGEDYPDIPLLPGRDNQWIRDLDRLTLREHIQSKLTVPTPARLEAAIQGYCTSSFGAGWDEISAASGWNFIAAEEFGRWILPGGNAGFVQALWRRLADPFSPRAKARLRRNARVVDVRVLGRDRVRVTYSPAPGVYRALIAKRVVLACPKHVCRYLLHDLEARDPDRHAATYRIRTTPYLVANVLLNRRVALDWYDAFNLGDGSPIADIASGHRVTDVVNGHFAQPRGASDVLSMYWPMPFTTARFQIIPDGSLAEMAHRLAGILDELLAPLGVSRGDVRQVRMARWGHALPVAAPNLIADGVCDLLRAPYMEHIYFVHQDNWALPAVETCLLEALAAAPKVAVGL